MRTVTYRWQPAYDDGEVLDHTIEASYEVPNPNAVAAGRAGLGSALGALAGLGGTRAAEMATNRRLRHLMLPGAAVGAAIGAMAAPLTMRNGIRVEPTSVRSAGASEEEARDALAYLTGHMAGTTFESKWGYLPTPVE